MARPTCSKCGGTSFTWTSEQFNSIQGFWIYCTGCGTPVTWTPKPT